MTCLYKVYCNPQSVDETLSSIYKYMYVYMYTLFFGASIETFFTYRKQSLKVCPWLTYLDTSKKNITIETCIIMFCTTNP